MEMNKFSLVHWTNHINFERNDFMNKIILMGYLSRMPELRRTEGENPISITRFDIAVNRRGKDR